MAVFKYNLVGSDGKKKRVEYVSAYNVDGARKTLKDHEIKASNLKDITDSFEMKSLFILNRVKKKDLVVFFRQFSVMISANLSVVRALNIITTQTKNPKLKIIVSELAYEVDSGTRLSAALSKREDVFSAFYINVIKSGETSGKLDEVLNYLADEVEKDNDIVTKIRNALIYPAFIIVALIGVGVFMMVFVVPKLTEILEQSGAELPLATRIIIGISDFLSSYWWLLILLILTLISLFRLYTRTDRGRRQIDYLKLKLPVFGGLFQRVYIVRFTRSMQTLVASGITITNALDIVSEVVDNEIYKDLILQTEEEVEGGNSLAIIFEDSKEIPPMVSQMIKVGEKTGRLETVLDNVTDFYSKEAENMVSNLVTLLEPFVIVVMGLGVGVMIAAIILPMYNLANNM